MKELIKITEKDGKQAVSARELHEFLESKRDFSNWIKERIRKYGFIENQDYEVFNNFGENPSGGRPTVEYALTIDAAKELSMVEGNEKGKQARRYFIDCEKKLKEIVAKPLSQLEILVQSAQMLLEQEKRISAVENKIDAIENSRKEATKELLSVPLSTEKIPEITPRAKVVQCVNSYAKYTGIKYSDVWHKVYHQLYYLYKINVNAYKRADGENNLDVAERNCFLDKMYNIISNMLRELED